MTQEQNNNPETPRDRKRLGELIDETVTSSYADLLAIIEARVELVKIEITEKIAVAVSLLVLALVLVTGLAYLVSTIALFVGELLGHAYLGYLTVSAFFLLTVLFFGRIQPHLLKNIIHKILLSSHGKKS